MCNHISRSLLVKELDILFNMIKQGESPNKNFAFIGIPNEKDTALINAVTESNHQIKITFLQDASQTIKNNLIDCVIVSSQYVINNDFYRNK